MEIFLEEKENGAEMIKGKERWELESVFKMKSFKAKVECEGRRAFSNRLIETRQLISPFFVLFGVFVYSVLFPGGLS